MEIIKNLTNVNRSVSKHRNISYIVIHYVGGFGTAKQNSEWFKHTYRGASSHFFVDDKFVYQSVDEANIAWHCGDSKKGPYADLCTNVNSISVEMCVLKKDKTSKNATDKDWYFHKKTVANTLELVAYLMHKYRISIDHVIRHYDVTLKTCPRPFVGDDTNTHYKQTGNVLWNNFKKQLGEIDMTQIEFEERMAMYLDKQKKQKPSEWSEEAREWAEKNKIVVGDENGEAQYKAPMTKEQVIVCLKRAHDLK